MSHLPINFAVNALLISLFFLIAPAAAAELTSVKTVIGSGYLRTTIITQENTTHRLFRVTNPDRLVIYLSNTVLKNIPDSQLLLPSPLKKLRYGIHKEKNLQLIFDLEEPLAYEAESLYDADKSQFRLTITLKSPDFQLPPQPKTTAKTITNKNVPLHILAVDKTDERKPIQFDGNSSESTKSTESSTVAIFLPSMRGDTHIKQPKNAENKSQTKKRRLSSLIKKLKKYSHINLYGYGTFGIQSYPKKSTKKSSRIDFGYKSNIGSVDFGVGFAKPVIFVSTKISNANIRLLVEEEGGTSQPKAKLGVAMKW